MWDDRTCGTICLSVPPASHPKVLREDANTPHSLENPELHRGSPRTSRFCIVQKYWHWILGCGHVMYDVILMLCRKLWPGLWIGNGSWGGQLRAARIMWQQMHVWTLNEWTNCRAKSWEGQQRWHMWGGPCAARPPRHANRKGVWTFASSHSVHHPANGAHQLQGERESPPEVGAGRWVAGVGEHLTQTLFVLWTGVHITVKVCVLGGQTKVSELGYEYKKETSLFPLRNGNCPSLISILKWIIIYLLIWGVTCSSASTQSSFIKLGAATNRIHVLTAAITAFHEHVHATGWFTDTANLSLVLKC